MKPKRLIALCASAAAILLLLVCLIARTSFWFWVCWQIVAAGLVTVGCVGEWHLFLRPPKEGDQEVHQRKTLRFITFAAIGACMQFIALAYTIPDALRLQKEVTQAKEGLQRAEVARLELEKQVLELVKATKARTISRQIVDKLSRDLIGVPTGQIEILAFDKDPEAIAFGLSLKRALVEAGCTASFSPKSIFNLDIIPSIAELGPDLVFCVKEPSSPPMYARIILSRLQSFGVKADGWPYNDSFTKDHLQIWVCPKAKTALMDEQTAEPAGGAYVSPAAGAPSAHP